MTDQEERQKLHDADVTDLYKRQLSNSENFDRSILSLSSGILALSIAFIRTPNTPNTVPQHLSLLSASWVTFAIAIILTVASFMTSQRAIEKRLDLSYRYYMKNEDDALTMKNRFATITTFLNLFSGAAFVVGVGLTIAFAIANLP